MKQTLKERYQLSRLNTIALKSLSKSFTVSPPFSPLPSIKPPFEEAPVLKLLQ